MRWLLHLDMDQFIVAVEVRRRPELRGRPVVVGGTGDPTRARQVVASASYEARAFGVRSGMPLRTAVRRCPEAVFLPSDAPAYEAASAQVMAVVRRFGVPVEVWGWDEAFLGGEIADPLALATELRAAVLAGTGLSCTIGIGHNKHQAKVAARFGKPAGVYQLTTQAWPAVMGDRPAADLWGIGPRTARKLDGLGIGTVAELAAADPDVLTERFGPRLGAWLPVLARGGGDTHIVTEPWVARSRSKETTFERDLTDPAEIHARLDELSRELAREVVDAGREIARVAVKVRFAPFFTQTRIMKLRPGPTTDPEVFAGAALTVLDLFALDRPVRLLGVRAELTVE